MDVSGLLWISRDFYVLLWTSVDFLWTFMDFYGLLWTSMLIYGLSTLKHLNTFWMSFYGYGHESTTIDIYRYHWTSLNII